MRPWIKRLSMFRRNDRLPIVLRGRRFTYRGLRVIIQCVAEHYFEGRTRISEVVCVRLAWRQPNGWLKDRACRDVLRHLEKLHLIKLPPRLTEGNAKKHTSSNYECRTILPVFDTPVVLMPAKIELEFAKGNSAEQIWNALIQVHHYLGHRVQVGRCIKYLIKGDGKLIGAISFSSPAWKLAVRDQVLERVGLEKSARDVVINNSRFCILPHVRVPHLASRVLAYATKQVATDWSNFYSITPLIAETFVELGRFEGTCYRAANWSEIGITSGYAKVGSNHHNSQQPKMIFVYGLTRVYRRRIMRYVSALNCEEVCQ